MKPAEAAAEAKMPLLREGNKLVLVKDREPAASIIVASDVSEKVVEHAQFLQKTIEEMTGVRQHPRTGGTGKFLQNAI